MPFAGNRTFKILFVCLLIAACGCEDRENHNNPGAQLTDFQEYLLEITFGNEFGATYSSVRKWEDDIKIYVPITRYRELNEELDRIITELNGLNGAISISRVDSLSESNYVVFFGKPDSYVSEYEPNARDRVEANYGLFWVYWNANYEIYRGSLYVDVFRATDPACRNHLLREELTQSLGLMNDSNRYSDSIFYGSWTCTTEYSELDREVIETFQSAVIDAGMDRQEVIDALRSR